MDSANIDGAITWPASQISFGDTGSFYSSVTIEGALQEPTTLQKGLLTIHCMPQGTNALVLFPGHVEVNGAIGVISTKLEVSGMTMIDSGVAKNGLYILVGAPAIDTEITASDVFLVEDSSITISASYQTSRVGWYYDNKRLIGAVYTSFSGCQNLSDYYNPEIIGRRYSKFLTETEACSLGFTNIHLGGGGACSTFWNTIVRYYDNNIGSYGYCGEMGLGSACASALAMFSTPAIRYMPSLNGPSPSGTTVVLVKGLGAYFEGTNSITMTITATVSSLRTAYYDLKPISTVKGNY